VDPTAVLRQLQAELKPRLEAQNVELLLPESPPSVLCDRTRLYQLFANLVGNALDHMGERTQARVQVEAREREGELLVTVRDNGRGIHPRDHERVFEIFQSLTPRSDGRRGTGIGLAIVKKIVEAYGGRIWLESTPGSGAAFHFTLPRA
jgi:signal transduction histidine kinase